MPIPDNGSVQSRDVDWRYDIEDQNTIRDENMFREDVDLQRRIFLDACNHSGYKVEYFEAEKEVRDIYYDPIVRWKPSIILPCMFEDHPRVKVLKEYGWYEPDSELNVLLYLSTYKRWETKEILDVKDQSLFRVTYFGQNYPVDFRLADKRYDSVYATYWILKLAPEHLDNFTYVTEHGSHYLKRNESESSKCEHKKDPDNQRDRRIYQNEDLEAYLFGKSGEKVSDNRPYSSDKSMDEFTSYSQLIMGGDD